MAFTRCRWSLTSPILFSICIFFVRRALARVVVSLHRRSPLKGRLFVFTRSVGGGAASGHQHITTTTDKRQGGNQRLRYSGHHTPFFFGVGGLDYTRHSNVTEVRVVVGFARTGDGHNHRQVCYCNCSPLWTRSVQLNTPASPDTI